MELAELLSVGPPSCLPSGLCRPYRPAPPRAAEAGRWLQRCAVDAELEMLRREQRRMGDFRLVTAHSSGCDARWGTPPPPPCCALGNGTAAIL